MIDVGEVLHSMTQHVMKLLQSVVFSMLCNGMSFTYTYPARGVELVWKSVKIIAHQWRGQGVYAETRKSKTKVVIHHNFIDKNADVTVPAELTDFYIKDTGQFTY